MSAIAPLRARAAQRSAPAAAPRRGVATRPALRLVQSPASTRGRLAFVVLVGAVLAGGLVVLLLLHTLAAQDAFTLHRLQARAATLGDTEQELTVADQQAAAPSVLARRARALGMVPTGPMTIVHRRDGRILGVATAAYVPAPPTPAPSAQPTPSASAAPTASATPAASATGGTRPASPPASRHRPRRH